MIPNMFHQETTRDSLRLLAKVLLSKLERSQAIQVDTEKRFELQKNVEEIISRFLLTDEDLRLKATQVSQEQVSREAAFQFLKKKMKDDSVSGFYCQKPIASLAESLVQFLLKSDFVEEVYLSDEEIISVVVTAIRGFDLKNIH